MMAGHLGKSFPYPINEITPRMVSAFKLRRLAEVKSEICRGQFVLHDCPLMVGCSNARHTRCLQVTKRAVLTSSKQ